MYGEIKMKKNIMKHEIESYCKELYEKYNVVKEIDFNEDIDVEKSDRYVIDEESGSLEFLFKEVEKIEFEDYKLYRFGEFELTQKGIHLIPMIDIEIDDSIKRSQVFIKKPILVNRTPLVYVSFNTNKDAILCVRIVNQFFYDTCRASVEGKIPWNSELKQSNEFQRTEAYFSSSDVFIQQQAGLKKVYIERDVHSSFNSTSGNCVFNTQKGYLAIKEKKEKLYHKGIFQEQKCYMSISCNSIKPESHDISQPDAYIEEVIFAKEDGFIYLKPLKNLMNKKVQIMMLCSEEVIGQYYNQYQDRWIDVSCNETLQVKEMLRLRIYMNFANRIYNIFILE
jgi:hypothetical protein